MPEVLFVINSVATLHGAQTTAELMAAVHGLGHRAWVASMDDLGLAPTGVSVAAKPWSGSLANMLLAPLEERPVASFEGVWIRTNPGRAEQPRQGWLELLSQVANRGTLVRNDPRGLAGAASKLHLGSLPAGTIPRTWSSSSAARLNGFLDELGCPGVLKPVLGTRGNGVIRIDPSSPDRLAILEAAVLAGPMLLQDYLPEAPSGDVRIHLIDGEILEVDGHACAVRRIPGDGEWRSNVALGGTPSPALLTAGQKDVARRVGAVVREQGLWHVGLDVVGEKVVECNVFSPGGLRDAGNFEGVDFITAAAVRFLEAL